MQKLLLLMVVSLMLAGVASANTVWNPAGNGINPPDVGNWNVGASWANGLPGDGTDALDSKAVFNLPAATWCIVDSAVAARTMSMSVGSVETGLRIVDGGSLLLGRASSADWHGVGYSAASRLDVERGGYIELDDRCIFGRSALDAGIRSQININGGTFKSFSRIQMYDFPDDIGGDIRLNGGLMDLGSGGLDWRGSYEGFPGGSSCNINFGTIIVSGDDTGQCQTAINDGGLTAWDGLGTVIMDYNVRNAGKTTITAIGDPLNRIPTYDAYASTDAALPLSWINLDPNNPADADVYVDVWFGTDDSWVTVEDVNAPDYPGYLADFAKVVDADVDGMNVTTVNVDASVDGQEYIWRVDTYRFGDPTVVSYVDDGDPNTIDYPVDEGVKMYFTAVGDYPIESVVIDTPSMVTWAGEPIHLSATVTDDNTSAVTITWTSDEPNAVFTNEVYTYNGDGTGTATADVTVDYHAAQFNVTLEAEDSSVFSEGPVSDTVSHDCAETACQATDVLGYVAANPADINGNCEIELDDLLLLVTDWLEDYTITLPTAIPQ